MPDQPETPRTAGGIRALGSALATTSRARAERRGRGRGRAARPTADAQVGRLRVSWTLLVVGGLAVVGTFTLAPSVGLLIEQRQTIAALQDQVAEQEQSVDELGEQVAQWSDPAYIEAQARDRLFYVYPGETAYVVMDDRGPAALAEQEGQPSTDLVETEGDWIQAGVASVMLAGITDAVPEDLGADTPVDGE